MNLEKFKECPSSPNCVSTQTQQSKKSMKPIPFSLPYEEVASLIKSIISNYPRTQFVKQKSHYLHFTFKSKVFGFVDDVEFLILENEKMIHFKSASRTGYGDHGVNRDRMADLSEKIKIALKFHSKEK